MPLSRRTLLAASALSALTPALALAAPSGDYRLVFLTADATTSTSTDIATYNSFVNTEATLTGTLLPASTWAVLGSTATMNAVTNANSLCNGNSACINAPLYEVVLNPNSSVSDVLVASSLAAMFAGNISSTINALQNGNQLYGFAVTGTNDNGTTATGNELGASQVATGLADSNTPPTEAGTFNLLLSNTSQPKSVYGISGLLQSSAVPEPASAALLGVGAGLMLVMRRRRKAA